jgi:hypothetical protein
MWLSSWLITVNWDPILDALLRQAFSSHEVIINMIETFSPSINPLLGKIDEFGAKSTPETGLAVAANAAAINLGLDSFSVRSGMILLQVILERVFAVTNLCACASFWLLLITAPCLKMEVLRVLVALPIVLTAKSFTAVQEGAAVWPRMTFHVFPMMLAGECKCRERTYFSSQGRPLNFPHFWQTTRLSLLLLAADPGFWGLGEWLGSL